MSFLSKKREQMSQRMNGLNDPVKPQASSTGQSYNGWPMIGMETAPLPHPEPMMVKNPRMTATCPLPAPKDVSMQSLLQQSCLHQAEMKPKKFEQSTDGWYVPEPAYQDMKFESPLNPNELPQGAYFEEPVYLDHTTGKPMTYETTEQPAAAPTIVESNLEQQNRCINANCPTCKSSMQAK